MTAFPCLAVTTCSGSPSARSNNALFSSTTSPTDADRTSLLGKHLIELCQCFSPLTDLCCPSFRPSRSEGLGTQLQPTAPIALARLDAKAEASAALDAAEGLFGSTSVLSEARKVIAGCDGRGFEATVSTEDDRLQDVKVALFRFKNMNPSEQASVYDRGFDELVVDLVRSAASSVVALVPMMKGVQFDAVEDDITALIQHLLAPRVESLGWSVPDQSRGGFSAHGNPGERDLVLRRGVTDLAVIEAVICARPLSQDAMRADLESHFQKLFGYSTCRLFFHLTYAYSSDLSELFMFLESMAEMSIPSGFLFKSLEQIPRVDARPLGITALYESQLGEVRVVFLILDLGQKLQRDAAASAGATKARRVGRKNGK
jgi:hypothetical protein